MRMKTILLAVLASALSAGAAAARPAGDQGSFNLQVQGYVPVICRATVDANAAPSRPGLMQLGTMREFCNNGNGYEVWVDYSSNLAGSTLYVDGQRVNLTNQGSVRISRSNRAAVKSSALALQLANANTQGSISLRVVAL